MDSPRKIAIIGAGKMGEAIISGLLKSGAYPPQDILIFEISQNRCQYVAQEYKVRITSDINEAVNLSEVIIIAVKPGVVGKVLESIKHTIQPGAVLLSIAAGVTIEFLEKNLPLNTAVIRVMPNLACSVGEAMIVVCPSKNTGESELKIATDVLSLLGNVLKLEEKYLNLATGLVGSGPAYIFVIIDALADAGVRLGLSKRVSTVLAAQTMLGAAKMVMETGKHPAQLKDMVATPAGTTVEGLLALEEGKFRATLISAVTEAAKRAKGLMPA